MEPKFGFRLAGFYVHHLYIMPHMDSGTNEPYIGVSCSYRKHTIDMN